MDVPPPLSDRRATAAAWILAVALLAVAAAGAPSRVFDLERYTLPKELVLHLTALVLLLLVPLRRPLRADALDLLLGGFVAWGFLSAALATNPWLAVRGAGLSFSAVVVFMAARRVAEAGRSGIVVGGAVAAGALAAGIGAAEAYGLEWIWHTDTRAPAGSFGNRNAMAHFLAIALPATAVAALHGRRPATRLTGGAAAALIALTLVLTRSRAAWLGAGAGLGVTALVLLLGAARPRARRLMQAGVLLLLAVAVAIAVPNRLAWRSDSPYAETLTGIANFREGSGRGRLIQYRHSLQLTREAPLLGGPGTGSCTTRGSRSPGIPPMRGTSPCPPTPGPAVTGWRSSANGGSWVRCCWRWRAGRRCSWPGSGCAGPPWSHGWVLPALPRPPAPWRRRW